MQNTTIRKIRHLFAAVLLALCTTHTALAQELQPLQMQPDGAEVAQFKAAHAKVTTVVQTWQARMAAATPADRAALQQQLNIEMTQAIETSGLSVASYNRIMQVLQRSPEAWRNTPDF